MDAVWPKSAHYTRRSTKWPYMAPWQSCVCNEHFLVRPHLFTGSIIIFSIFSCLGLILRPFSIKNDMLPWYFAKNTPKNSWKTAVFLTSCPFKGHSKAILRPITLENLVGWQLHAGGAPNLPLPGCARAISPVVTMLCQNVEMRLTWHFSEHEVPTLALFLEPDVFCR